MQTTSQLRSSQWLRVGTPCVEVDCCFSPWVHQKKSQFASPPEHVVQGWLGRFRFWFGLSTSEVWSSHEEWSLKSYRWILQVRPNINRSMKYKHLGLNQGKNQHVHIFYDLLSSFIFQNCPETSRWLSRSPQTPFRPFRLSPTFRLNHQKAIGRQEDTRGLYDLVLVDRRNGGFLGHEGSPNPWLLISTWYNDLDDLGLAPF